MKLERQKLNHIPALLIDFETGLIKEEIMNEVLSINVTEESVEPEDAHKMKMLYTECSCEIGKLYWQRQDIAEHDCEILLCGNCGKWTLEVTY